MFNVGIIGSLYINPGNRKSRDFEGGEIDETETGGEMQSQDPRILSAVVARPTQQYRGRRNSSAKQHLDLIESKLR